MLYGFKEWTLICEALAHGRQSLILRKGGIAEGRAGFQFAHPEFLLFPTLFHEQLEKTILPPETPLPQPRADGQIEIRCRLQVEWTRKLTDLELIRRLEPFHLWRPEVIEERFYYDEDPGISLAWVRAYRLKDPFVFPSSPAYGGCRSWVKLPEPPADLGSEPALDEATHRSRERQVLDMVGPA